MFITAFGPDDSRRLAVEMDPVVLKAIESLPKAKELLDNVRQLLVQRRQAAGQTQ